MITPEKRLVAFPLFVALVVYAGALYVFFALEPKYKEKAHKILRGAVIGFIIALAAWLAIDLILNVLTNGGGLGRVNIP